MSDLVSTGPSVLDVRWGQRTESGPPGSHHGLGLLPGWVTDGRVVSRFPPDESFGDQYGRISPERPVDPTDFHAGCSGSAHA